MNPTAIAGGVILVMGLAVFFLFKAYTGQVELRVEATIAAESQRLAREYQEKTAAISQAHADALAERDRQTITERSERQNEISQLRAVIESRAIEEPFDTGNDFERRLAGVMCRVQAGGSPAARKACDLRAAQTYSPNRAIVVTVTADTAEQWKERCDEGERDLCDYAIVGLTAQGALTVLDWLEDVDAYQAQLNAYIDSQASVLEKISE